MNRCLSEYTIDRYLLNIQSTEERKETESHIHNCAHCQKNVHVLQASWNREIPAFKLVPLPRKASATQMFFPLAASAAALLAVVLLSPWMLHYFSSNRPIASTQFVIKGTSEPQLFVARRWNTQVKQASSGEYFPNGTQLRLAYRWNTDRYVFVVYSDEEKRLSPLYPETAQQKSLRIATQQTVLLPGSLKIEGIPKHMEILWACFS